MIVGFSIFSAAIELPLYLAVGLEKTAYIKTGFLTLIAFILIGYILFDDLSVFEEIDITTIVAWFMTHLEVTHLEVTHLEEIKKLKQLKNSYII